MGSSSQDSLNAGGKIHELLVGKFSLIQKAADSEGPGLWQVVGSGWGAEVTEVRKLRGPCPVWLQHQGAGIASCLSP